jgi:hypothetical protein
MYSSHSAKICKQKAELFSKCGTAKTLTLSVQQDLNFIIPLVGHLGALKEI